MALTKPRIIELLLITTVPVMFLAAQGVPDLWLVVTTTIGGYLSAGGANALNMYIDRDIDALMDRTSQRPLVTGMVSPRECLAFGIALAVISTVWFGLLVNWLSAALSLGALLFYVVVYTMLLKRRTSQNIVWGGIAGCMPVLIGWSAVTDSMSLGRGHPFRRHLLLDAAALLAAVDEGQGGLRPGRRPDAPGRRLQPGGGPPDRRLQLGDGRRSRCCSRPLGYTGWFYTAVALLTGGFWLWEAHGLQNRAKSGVTGAKLKEMRLFHWSITYVSLLFVAVAVDPFLR